MLLKENSIRKEKIVKGKNRYYNFIFECVGCGTELNVQSSSLKTHSGKCRRCSQIGEPYRHIYTELKNKKRENKITVDLTFNEFKDIIENKNCHYCESEIMYHKHTRNWGKMNSRAHQLDRKNNDLGYTKENVVTCCWECNRLKSDRFTYEEFIQFSPILKKIQSERKRKETP
jgi:hypothetical protein